MPRVYRHDIIHLDAPTETPEGFLEFRDVAVTRTGVFEYVNMDGTIRRELRHPDDVFAKSHLDSMPGRPLTLAHPREGVVDEDNYWVHAEGSMSGPVAREDREGYEVVVVDRIVMAGWVAKMAYNDGVRELSLGYFTDLIAESGEFEGQSYDYRQTNMRVNHVAQVDVGRAGPVARLDDNKDNPLRLDSAGNQTGGGPIRGISTRAPKQKREKKMPQITIDGVSYEVDDGLATKLAAKLKTQDDTQKRADRAQGEADTLKVEVETLKAAQLNRDDIAKEIRAEMKARADLEAKCAPHLPEGTVVDGMSDRAVKVALIKTRDAAFNDDGKPDGYIDGRFDAALGVLATTETRIQEQRGAALAGTSTTTDSDGRKRVSRADFNKAMATRKRVARA